MRRTFIGLLLGTALVASLACGGAEVTPAVVPALTAPPVIAQGGGTQDAAPGLGSLRELSLRVAPLQSLAYRVKTKMEQPGRKVEQDFVLFLDAWSDGTLSLTHKTGDNERTASAREIEEFLPVPEGAQSTYTRKREGAKDQGEPDTEEHFQRQPLPGGKELITYRTEKKRPHSEEVSEGSGTFDVDAMRFEHLHVVKVRKMSFPKMKGPERETKNDVEVTYDAEGSAARAKERAARREIMLKASREPAGTANPAADLGAALSGQNSDSGIVEFLARGRPELVWRAALAQATTSDRLRALGFERKGVPDSVLADVKAALRKSPSHPVSWLVIGAREPRLVAELGQIATRHEDNDAREAATERLKELKKSLVPLAIRLRAQKPSKRGRFDPEPLFGEIDPDRDRAALFDYVVPKLTTASEEERSMLTQALQNLAKVSLGEEAEPWKVYWDSHKAKPYDEWLLEALASDASANARARAAEGLGERPVNDAIRKGLRAALDDKDGDVRIAAAEALATFKDDAAVRPLLRALPDDNMRWKAVLALSFFSDSDFGLSASGPGSSKPEELAVPLGRWLGWARQRGVDPGY